MSAPRNLHEHFENEILKTGHGKKTKEKSSISCLRNAKGVIKRMQTIYEYVEFANMPHDIVVWDPGPN
jgi:hypothetical protein